jgi:hypothetical protein
MGKAWAMPFLRPTVLSLLLLTLPALVGGAGAALSQSSVATPQGSLPPPRPVQTPTREGRHPHRPSARA